MFSKNKILFTLACLCLFGGIGTISFKLYELLLLKNDAHYQKIELSAESLAKNSEMTCKEMATSLELSDYQCAEKHNSFLICKARHSLIGNIAIMSIYDFYVTLETTPSSIHISPKCTVSIDKIRKMP